MASGSGAVGSPRIQPRLRLFGRRLETGSLRDKATTALSSGVSSSDIRAFSFRPETPTGRKTLTKKMRVYLRANAERARALLTQ
ncbi:hypothetical protein CVN68_09625 [Sphingomonas psychrotolerans]|uniref:Uncharacterized protein n=1 Tax=Sphingomonas psychrotolerans TaxID=1327635 RepID=A0A2K8MGU6_9SPHN|nr:hypothetical protein CVN68_09625 [Sphingomonas psychrotolerans]